jgi:hypothetical protein
MEELPDDPLIQNPKRFRLGRFLKRLFLTLFALFALLIAAGTFVAWKYEDEVKSFVASKIFEQLNTQVIVKPADIGFSVLENFPNASVDFHNIRILDAVLSDSPKDTLLKAGVISLQFNIRDLYNKHYVIKRIDLKDLVLKLRVDKKGQDNFHILKATTDTTHEVDTSVFALDKIELRNAHIEYKNLKTKDDFSGTLSKVDFKGKFSSQNYTLETDLQMFVDHLISNKVSYIQNRNIALNTKLDVTGNTYSIRKGEIKLGSLNLVLSGTIIHQDTCDIMHLTAGGKNMDIQSAFSWMPGRFKKDIEEFQSKGNFYFHTTINGCLSKKSTPTVNASFGISKGEVSQTKANLTMKNVELKGEYSNAGKGRLDLSDFSGNLPQGRISGSFKLDNFKDPLLNAKAEGNIDLAELQKFLRIDTIESLSGKMKINATFVGHVRKTAGSLVSEDKTGGEISFSNMTLRLRKNNLRFDNFNGTLSLANNDVQVNGLTGKISHSDISVDGTFKNMLAWMLIKDEKLTANITVKAKKIDLNDLLNDKTNTPSKADPTYKLTFSRFLDLTLNSEIDELVFRKFQATDIRGVIRLKDKRLVADPLTFHTMDGTITTSGSLDATRSDSIFVGMNADLKGVNVTKAFAEMENFGQETLVDKNVKGLVTAKIQMAVPCSPDLTMNAAKLLAKCDVTIVKGELIKLASLKSLSKFISLSELEDIRFETLTTNINIQNRIIGIPLTQINSNAMDIEVSGTQDFDSNVDYVFGLYLSEILARKARESRKENTDFGEEDTEGKHRLRLYISMKGPIANPKIAYDHKASQEERKKKRKEEKENIKGLLNHEFGLFKNDSLAKQHGKDKLKKGDPKFSIQFDEEEKKKKKDTKTEDDDF